MSASTQPMDVAVSGDGSLRGAAEAFDARFESETEDAGGNSSPTHDDETDDPENDVDADPIRDDGEGEEADSDPDLEDDDDEVATADDGDGDDDSGLSLQEVAEANGVSVDDILSQIHHTFVIDGEETTLPLSELVRGHQREKTFHKRVREVEGQRQALQQAEQTIAQHYTEQLGVLARVAPAFKKLLVQELDSPAMMALRAQNPAEWAAREAEIRQRDSQITNYINALTAEVQRNDQQRQARDAEIARERLQAEYEKLTRAIPSYDEAHAGKIARYALGNGWTRDEVSNLTDSRLVIALDKARQFDALTAKGLGGKPKAEKLKARLKGINPRRGEGAVSAPVSRRGKQAMRQLKKTGKLQDAATAFDLRLRG